MSTPPANSSNLLSSAGTDPSLILGGSKLPPIYFRGQRVQMQIEALVAVPSVAPFNPFSLSSILSRKRYFRQIWLYGIGSFSGGLPVPNAANIAWGFSGQTLVNTLPPWGKDIYDTAIAGGFGGLIQCPDGAVFDLAELWCMGSLDDSIFIAGQ
jgi:hypothetical protein